MYVMFYNAIYKQFYKKYLIKISEYTLKKKHHWQKCVESQRRFTGVANNIHYIYRVWKKKKATGIKLSESYNKKKNYNIFI